MKGGHAEGDVVVAKLTRTRDETWVTSFHRLLRDEALRDREIRRLLAKGKK